MNDMAIEPLDPDVVAARAFVTEVGVAALTRGKTSVPLQALVALVEKVVKERHIIAGQWEHAVKACGLLRKERDAALRDRDALAKQANEMEERAERNAALHAEVMRERDALLKPHNSDGTITCPECHKSMGGDGIVEALRECVKERDLLRDKWNQMEAYGFDSPSQVFARLEAAEKAQKEAEERIDNANRALGNAVSLEEAVRQTLLETHEMEEELKEAEERLKEAHVWRCDCEMDDPKSSDNDCIELRTRTETKA